MEMFWRNIFFASLQNLPRASFLPRCFREQCTTTTKGRRKRLYRKKRPTVNCIPVLTMTEWQAQFGSEILTKEGKKPTAEVLKDKKRIGIYFSAHWYFF